MNKAGSRACCWFVLEVPTWRTRRQVLWNMFYCKRLDEQEDEPTNVLQHTITSGYPLLMGKVLRKRLAQSQFEDSAQEAVLNLLVAAAHVRERTDRVCSKFSITRGQYNILRILYGAQPNSYSRGEIMKRLIERAPDVTRLIDQLERRGLVKRERSDRDRRVSMTRITRTGMSLVRRMNPMIIEAHADLLEKLSGRNGRELSRICELLYGEEQ